MGLGTIFIGTEDQIDTGPDTVTGKGTAIPDGLTAQCCGLKYNIPIDIGDLDIHIFDQACDYDLSMIIFPDRIRIYIDIAEIVKPVNGCTFI